MESKLQEYMDRFGEQFPLMMVQGMEDSEIIKLVDGCLESGEPYEPDYEDGVLY